MRKKPPGEIRGKLRGLRVVGGTEHKRKRASKRPDTKASADWKPGTPHRPRTSIDQLERQNLKDRILEARRARLSVRKIAELVGAPRSTVQDLLKEIWTEAGPSLGNRLELLELELSMYDKLTSVWLPRATGYVYDDTQTKKRVEVQPDIEAVRAVLAISAGRREMLALNHKTVDYTPPPATAGDPMFYWTRAGWTSDEVRAFIEKNVVPDGKALPPELLAAR